MNFDRTEMQKKIMIVLDIQEDIMPDANISDYAEMDSLAILSLLSMIDEEYNIMIDPEQLGGSKTINDIISLIMG